MKIKKNISRFERHLKGAKALKDKNLSDYLIYNTLAMECFQSANALIDIAKAVVIKKKLGSPSTYSEIFEILNKNGIINEEELEKAKRIVFLRNLIAHEYYRIKEKDLKDMVDFLEEMRRNFEKRKWFSLSLIIAHEYYRIEEKDLKNMVDFLEEMRNFINKVKKMVKEGEL